MLPTTRTRLRTKIANSRFTISSRLTKRSTNFICVASLTPKCTSYKARRWILSAPRCHVAAVFRVAHASRVLAKASRLRGLFCKDCFGETPKPARETRARPENYVAHLLQTCSPTLLRCEVGYFLAVANYDVAIIGGGPA